MNLSVVVLKLIIGTILCYYTNSIYSLLGDKLLLTSKDALIYPALQGIQFISWFVAALLYIFIIIMIENAICSNKAKNAE